MKKLIIVIMCISLLVGCKETSDTYEIKKDYADEELLQNQTIDNQTVELIIDNIESSDDAEYKLEQYRELWDITVVNNEYDPNIAFENIMMGYVYAIYTYGNKEEQLEFVNKVFDLGIFNMESRYNALSQLTGVLTSDDEEEIVYIIDKLEYLLENEEKYSDNTVYTSNLLMTLGVLYKRIDNAEKSEEYRELLIQLTEQ